MGNLDLLCNALSGLKIIELSHPFEEHMPAWPTHSKYFHTLWNSYEHGDRATTYQIIINEHNGTHIDAPAHFIREGKGHTWIDEMPAATFLAVCRTLDVSFLPKKGEVTKEHIVDWENKNGAIEKDEAVFFYFGWSKLWNKRPNDTEFSSDWPGVGRTAAEYLLDKKVKLVGVDTLAADVCNTVDFPCHYTLLGNNIPIIENLNNLDKMSTRAYFMALPLMIREGSASPVRAVGFVEK